MRPLTWYERLGRFLRLYRVWGDRPYSRWIWEVKRGKQNGIQLLAIAHLFLSAAVILLAVCSYMRRDRLTKLEQNIEAAQADYSRLLEIVIEKGAE